MKEGEYVGWHKYTNFGDDILYQIITRYGFVDNPSSDNIIYGGGTIFPLNDKLNATVVNKTPKNVACIGTGISSKEFYNADYEKDMETTREVIRDGYVGIRSTAERDRLGMGEVIGDPFFSIQTPETKITKDLVILNVGQSHGNCWGGLRHEQACFYSLLNFVKKQIIEKEGKEVIVVYLWKADETTAITASKYLQCGYVNHIPTLNEAIRLFGAAEKIITYKLHAMITALLVNRPVLPIEYHQKIRDVADDFEIDTLKVNEVTSDRLNYMWSNLDNWDYEKVKAQKEKFALATFNFINTIKDGEKDE